MAARKGFVPVWKLCVTRVIPVGMATGAAMEFFMIKTGFCRCTTRMHNPLLVLHTFLRLFTGCCWSLAAAVDCCTTPHLCCTLHLTLLLTCTPFPLQMTLQPAKRQSVEHKQRPIGATLTSKALQQLEQQQQQQLQQQQQKRPANNKTCQTSNSRPAVTRTTGTAHHNCIPPPYSTTSTKKLSKSTQWTRH